MWPIHRSAFKYAHTVVSSITHQFFAGSRLHVVGVGVGILQCVATLGRGKTNTHSANVCLVCVCNQNSSAAWHAKKTLSLVKLSMMLYNYNWHRGANSCGFFSVHPTQRIAMCIHTLASSLAAFCMYCQSIQVPRLFMTLSWIFSWMRWYVWASSCKLLLWFSH